MSKKKGLIVGINYVGTGNDLKGCINDANNMQALLKGRGFTEIEMCLEQDATTSGIKAALARLVQGAVPGDVLVFHYSGHGSQLPSKTEADGFEEIICPIDLNWTTRVIKDADLKKVFDPVPNGVNVTLILDCCHSGDGLNQDETECDDDHSTASREAVGLDPDGSAGRFLPPPEKIQVKLENTELVQWTTERDVNKSALLIAGCHSDQTSADAFIDGSYQGAASYSLRQVLTKNPQASYKQIIRDMNAFMTEKKFTQRPQLDGAKNLYPEIFAEPFGSVDFGAAAPVPVPTATPVSLDPMVDPFEGETGEPEKKSDNAMKIVIFIVVLAMIAVFSLL